MDDALEEAFDQFVGARERPLLGFALLLTADLHAAEDLLQVGLTRLYLHWRKIRPDHAEAWVRRVMVNANISRWRRLKGRERLGDDAEERPDDVDPEAAVDQRDELRRALAALGPRQRTAVVLRYYTDLTEQEAAAVMGCSVGTVKSQTARGLVRLRAHLAKTADMEAPR
jgi:RNA polymerase sigma-70 factor (sigma-E family)